MGYTAVFEGRMQIPYAYGTYGYKRSSGSTHKGVDIVGLDSAYVRAAVGGKVLQSRIVTDKSNVTWEWGNYVSILGDDGLYHFYCHLESRAVISGQRVDAGQTLGVMGNTGNAAMNTPPYKHLHYEVRKTSASASHTNPCAYAHVENKTGTYGTATYKQESEENMSKYRIYDVVYASTEKDAAIAEFKPLKQKAPSEYILTNAGADGRWRIGKVYMATENLDTALANMTSDRILC